MKVKVPKKIWIGATDYKIKLSEHLRIDEARFGCIDRRLGTITIDKYQRNTSRSVSFYHEVLHQINDDVTLHLDDDDIDRLATALNLFLVQNKLLELDWEEK